MSSCVPGQVSAQEQCKHHHSLCKVCGYNGGSAQTAGDLCVQPSCLGATKTPLQLMCVQCCRRSMVTVKHLGFVLEGTSQSLAHNLSLALTSPNACTQRKP